MDKNELERIILEVFEKAEGNFIPKDGSNRSSEGMAIYERPIIGIGSPKDDLFETFRNPDVIGPWFKTPTEWLSGARSVISLFFPFTETVKDANRKAQAVPSYEWLCGRIEGQEFIDGYMAFLEETLKGQGYKCCVPSSSPDFQSVRVGIGISGYDCINEKTFGSNWSERHAAYVCGLGTFGLSKCLITEKGCAGRFASIITDCEIQPDKRKYTEIYEYCTRCGSCSRRCMVKAISPESGKDLRICYYKLQDLKTVVAPRYGCGLCYTLVPCESGIPGR